MTIIFIVILLSTRLLKYECENEILGEDDKSINVIIHRFLCSSS